jgi:hypothetical protein
MKKVVKKLEKKEKIDWEWKMKQAKRLSFTLGAIVGFLLGMVVFFITFQ